MIDYYHFDIDKKFFYKFHFDVINKKCVIIRRAIIIGVGETYQSFYAEIENNNILWGSITMFGIHDKAKEYVEKIFRNKAFL